MENSPMETSDGNTTNTSQPLSNSDGSELGEDNELGEGSDSDDSDDQAEMPLPSTPASNVDINTTRMLPDSNPEVGVARDGSPQSSEIKIEQWELNDELFSACDEGRLDDVKEYLDQGADPNGIIEADEYSNLIELNDSCMYGGYPSCLHITSYEGHLPVVMELLNHKDIDITVKDIDGFSPLLYATLEDHHDIQDCLIKKGLSLNDNDKNMLLLKACSNKDTYNLDTIKEYLHQGADPNWSIKDDREIDWTSFKIACDIGHHEVVNVLINNGADINAKDKHDETPLMTACVSGHHEIVNILINNGEDINAKDESDWTPLMYACIKGHHEVVNILINNGADINAKNKRGWTAVNILENTNLSEDQEKCLDLLRKATQLKDDNSHVHGSGSKPTSADTSIAERDPYFRKAVSEGSGTLKPAVVVMHGPPGAGKTSVKQLLLGRPPLSPQEQNSTGVFERPIRTCRMKTHGVDELREVNKKEFLQLLANNVKSRTSKLKEKSSTTRRPSQRLSPDPPIDSEEHTFEPHAQIELNQVIRDIHTRLPSSRSSRSDLFDLDWIYLVDSGGQPQFADILPVLFQSEEALYVVVLRLDQSLDERHHNRYCVNGFTYELPETLELNNRQLIERACQIAEAQSTKSSQKCVMIVGTCLDLVTADDVAKLDKELLTIKKKYSKVVVPRDVSHGKIIFSVNAMSTGPERVKYTKDLQQCLIKVVKRSIKPSKVPIRWFVYELSLEEESQSSHGIVKKDKCMTLGRASGLNEEEIEESLKFFNKIAVHLYHPDIGDMVLIKMDPLTNRVSALIKTSFIPPQFNPIEDSDRLKQRGLMNKSYLDIAFEDLNDDNCITNEAFLKITQCLKIVVPVGLDEYFIPSALSVNTDHSIPDSPYTPCVFSWDDRIIPPGFFFTLIVILLQLFDEHSANHFVLATVQVIQSRDRISLISKAYGGVVTFFNKHEYVWIHYTGGRGFEDYIDVLKLVVKAMPTAIEKFTKIKFPCISFFCSICDGKRIFHPCQLNIYRDYCICPLDQRKMEPLTEEMKAILQSLQDHVKKASPSISQYGCTHSSATLQTSTSSDQSSSSINSQSSMDSTSSTSTTSSTGAHCTTNSSILGKRSSHDRTTIPHSHADTLKKYTSTLMKTVSDPNLLATNMWSKQLIDDVVMDEVTTTLGLSRNEKLSKLFLNFHNSLPVASIKSKLLVKKFCDVLKAHSTGTDALNSIILEMEDKLEL